MTRARRGGVEAPIVFDEYGNSFQRLGATLARRYGIVTEATQTRATGDSCPDCHAVVADLDAHKRWHSRLVSDLAHAVESEILRKQAGRA